MDEFPPNVKRPPETEEKDIHRVTSSDPKRRKKSLGKQFRETFISGSGRTAAQYVAFGVVLPALKDLVYEAGSGYLEKVMFGDTRAKRGGSAPTHFGYTNYQQVKTVKAPTMVVTPMSRRARARHDFDEIVLASRAEAEDVLERLYDALDKYDSVSVADLYVLVGEKIEHTDHIWGWTDLRGSSVSRLRNQGWLLDLPGPEPLK